MHRDPQPRIERKKPGITTTARKIIIVDICITTGARKIPIADICIAIYCCEIASKSPDIATGNYKIIDKSTTIIFEDIDIASHDCEIYGKSPGFSTRVRETIDKNTGTISSIVRDNENASWCGEKDKGDQLLTIETGFTHIPTFPRTDPFSFSSHSPALRPAVREWTHQRPISITGAMSCRSLSSNDNFHFFAF
jgi:hypothetical protein